MESEAITFYRCYLKVIMTDIAKHLDKATVRSASCALLSSWGSKKNYEFFVPSSTTVPNDIRIELWATNMYHARASAWEVILATINREPRSSNVTVLGMAPSTQEWLESLGRKK